MKKNVLVTGSSRGIGRETIIRFALHGCNVIINYLNSKEEAENLKKLVERDYGVRALTIKCDVSKEDEVNNMVEEIIREFGSIDILVNNAGISKDSLIEDKTIEDFKRVMEVNLIGTLLVSRCVAKHMLEKKTGRIVNVASTNGIDTGYPCSIDYDASKAAIISLSSNLAKEYAPYISVNTVAPGWVKTDMLKEMDENLIKEEENKILLGRFAEPKEIARVIFFLACESSSYVNNAIIRVDGGVK